MAKAKAKAVQEPTIEVLETPEAQEPAESIKKRKKLSKTIDFDAGTVTIEALNGNKGPVTFSLSDLPADITAKLAPFGLSHKLGDAAASRTGVEAEDAIQKVFDGLKNGDWSTRAPAKPKVSVTDLVENYSNLTAEQKAAAAPLLESLGITIPA